MAQLNPTALAIADGQLAAAKATLYAAPATVGVRVVIPRGGFVLVNTDTLARTVNIYLNRNGTSRRVLAADYTLQAGNDGTWTNEVSVFVLEPSDLIEGDASVANVVDYVISGYREDA